MLQEKGEPSARLFLRLFKKTVSQQKQKAILFEQNTYLV